MKHYGRHPMKKEVKKRYEAKTPEAAVTVNELSLVKTLTHNLMIGCKTFWLCEDPDHNPQIINLSSVLRQKFPFENM